MSLIETSKGIRVINYFLHVEAACPWRPGFQFLYDFHRAILATVRVVLGKYSPIYRKLFPPIKNAEVRPYAFLPEAFLIALTDNRLTIRLALFSGANDGFSDEEIEKIITILKLGLPLQVNLIYPGIDWLIEIDEQSNSSFLFVGSPEKDEKFRWGIQMISPYWHESFQGLVSLPLKETLPLNRNYVGDLTHFIVKPFNWGNFIFPALQRLMELTKILEGRDTPLFKQLLDLHHLEENNYKSWPHVYAESLGFIEGIVFKKDEESTIIKRGFLGNWEFIGELSQEEINILWGVTKVGFGSGTSGFGLGSGVLYSHNPSEK